MAIRSRTEYLILHCSDGKDDGGRLDWRNIRKYHIEERGWPDIGYHFGIERYRGDIILLPGCNVWSVGFHCKAQGRNHDSIGVCVVGDFDEFPPDAKLFNATVRVLAFLSLAWGLQPENIFGHREFDPERRTCPGLCWDMDLTRSSVAVTLNTPFDHLDL